MRTGLNLVVVLLGALSVVNPTRAIEAVVSETLQLGLAGFVEEHYNGAQALEAIEATMMSSLENEWVSGFKLQTVAVADTASGRSALVYFQDEEWKLRQEHTWIGVDLRNKYEIVALGESVDEDLGRALLKIVGPMLKDNEACSGVMRYRPRRTTEKWGADKATRTHEVRTGYDPPCCQSGRTFSFRAEGGTIELEGVGEWVF